MPKVLLVNDTERPIAGLCQAPADHGYEILPVVLSSRALTESVHNQRLDIVIVATDSPARDPPKSHACASGSLTLSVNWPTVRCSTARSTF